MIALLAYCFAALQCYLRDVGQRNRAFWRVHSVRCSGSIGFERRLTLSGAQPATGSRSRRRHD